MGKKIQTEEEKKHAELVEDIAVNIAQLSRQVSAILNGRIKTKAIVVLLAHSTGMSQRQVTEVLTALQNLEKDYLK